MNEVLRAKTLQHELAALLNRLLARLEKIQPPLDEQRVAFLRAFTREHGGEVPAGNREPLDRLIAALSMTAGEVDLLLIALMPEIHEGFCEVLRALNPRGEPRPSLGLAAQVLYPGWDQRVELRSEVESRPVFRSGCLRVTGDGPFFERTLNTAQGLWPALLGIPSWPASLGVLTPSYTTVGLDSWSREAVAARAIQAIRERRQSSILITADQEETALRRSQALVALAGREPTAFQLPQQPDGEWEANLQAQAIALDIVPVLRVPYVEGQPTPQAPAFAYLPWPLVIAARTGAAVASGSRPLLSAPVRKLEGDEARRMWGSLLPELKEESHRLASRYVVEPSAAAEAAFDARAQASLDKRPVTVQDVGGSLRARNQLVLPPGLKLVHATAGWHHLVLPPEREVQLREAAARLDHQARVLDEWKFLAGRPGARGVRLLFSGPPGTGKTLAAEVMAASLGVDLLVGDVSSLFSKWIGETEKNFAAAFDAAERIKAALFFDEADAIFGRRTEISDAHDRYANLETAYLLARLERFDGLVVLATNMRGNVDPAFVRRLDYLVEFHEPDREARRRLWDQHVPNRDLLDEDVNLYEFAALYPMVGALIRNASVSAAYLAAADGQRIGRRHLFRAIRDEFEKSGRAFPGFPAGVRIAGKEHHGSTNDTSRIG